MNYNQNKKIAQIISETLIIGVDTAKFKHQPELKTLEDQSLVHPVTSKIRKKDFGIFWTGSRK